MKPIIEIHQLSKKYQIGKTMEPYKSLRESIGGIFNLSKQKTQEFWALKEVSFNVEEGDTVGIVGRNGAGKSTLLKILSRITPPSSGRVINRGRIASLLEVGTGFHPELSGRENVMMNGSILGMKRSSILANFDNIVDFAGVGQFIDTPLKHYSSGMQLRLAFAVAAFLENEILIIDEVLAVGDAEFQKKCIGKMENVSKSGRTIIFVSHQMSAVISLCRKAAYLKEGRLQEFGAVDKIINAYTQSLDQQLLAGSTSKDGIAFKSNRQDGSTRFSATEPLCFYLECAKPVSKHDVFAGIAIRDKYDKTLMIDFFTFRQDQSEKISCEINLPAGYFTPGRYSIDLSLQTQYEQFWLKKDILQFEIDILGTIYEGLTYDYGVVRSIVSWKEK